MTFDKDLYIVSKLKSDQILKLVRTASLLKHSAIYEELSQDKPGL